MFRPIRECLNSTENHPQFSLKTAWIRGGKERLIVEIHKLLYLLIFRIFLVEGDGKKWGIAFMITFLIISFIGLFFMTMKFIEHVVREDGKFIFKPGTKLTDQNCQEKYFFISENEEGGLYYDTLHRALLFEYFIVQIYSWIWVSKDKRIWERGLKWHMYHCLMQSIHNFARGMIFLIPLS